MTHQRRRQKVSQKLLSSLALAALGVAAGCNVPPSTSAEWAEPDPGMFTTGPYILLGGEGKAFVVVKGRVAGAPRLEWWRESTPAVAQLDDGQAGDGQAGDGSVAPPPGAAVQEVTFDAADDLWIARLEGLPVGDEIAYRVTSSLGTTPTYRFRVGARRGQPFRFAAYGDTRTRDHIHREVVESLDREEIDFILHTGDMVERGGVREQWDRFFQIERDVLVDAPIIPSIGNHDVGARNYFRRYFLHRLWAKDVRYFAHDWGNVRVLAIDGGIECREGCDQYSYAERVLADGARKGMFMVIMLHYPPYSSGKHGSEASVQKPVSQLAERHGVELVVTGHDHNYERTKLINGVTYVVSGSAGAPIRSVEPRWFTAEARTEPHYVLVDVEADRMVLRAVNLRGDTFDTTVLEPNPPKPD